MNIIQKRCRTSQKDKKHKRNKSKQFVTPTSPKMEIKNINIFVSNENRPPKKLHKKTISSLQSNKPAQPKTKIQTKKIIKHQKHKSQENIKVNLFQWGTLLEKGTTKHKEVIAKYGYCNRGGMAVDKKNKINQDAFIIIENFMGKGKYLFGVCDGHGVNGHYVSEFIKQILPENLEYYFLKNKTFANKSQGIIQSSLKQTFSKTSKNLADSNIDIMFSGSTACILYINHNQIYCANVGDSRAILCSRTSDKWGVKQLSYDHKADDQRQAARIKMNGGRVFPYRDEEGNQLGPYRIWTKNQNVPGLAMARSFGDYVASTVGVISQPQITHHMISKDDKFIVVASDGLWQFISNQEVLKIVAPCFIRNDVEEAVKLLEKCALDSWKKQDQNIDDITIEVIFFKYY